MRYAYPVVVRPRLVANFPDVPEALTDGADEAEAVAEACDALAIALARNHSTGGPLLGLVSRTRSSVRRPVDPKFQICLTPPCKNAGSWAPATVRSRRKRAFEILIRRWKVRI